MGFAMKCDRCGVFYELYGGKTRNNGVLPVCRVNVNGAFYNDDRKPYDLCPDCMSEFENWLSDGKRFKDDTNNTQDEEK